MIWFSLSHLRYGYFMTECIFCQIAKRELPSDVVREEGQWLAFHDIHPQAPIHILVVPRQHIASLAKASEQDNLLLGHLLLAAKSIAQEQGVGSDYRIVLNTGEGAGQSVFHIHLHLLGGRAFSWPPG